MAIRTSIKDKLKKIRKVFASGIRLFIAGLAYITIYAAIVMTIKILFKATIFLWNVIP